MRLTSLAVPEASPAGEAPPRANEPRVERGGVRARLFRIISGAHALALADQAVVSATSFLTTVLIARWTGPSQLGAYAIGISLVASLLAVQDSLILLPYSIQRHRPVGTPAERAGASLTLSGLLSAASIVALALCALVLSARGAGPQMVGIAWAMVGVIPFVLIREFGRRYAFARLQMAQALILDVAVAAIQLAALVWLEWKGWLSAVTACAALGGACGLTAIGWLYLARGDFAVRVEHVRVTISQSWHLAKWLLVGRITTLVQGYIIYWLSIVIAGAAVTGEYAACMSIVAFANPVIFGFGNILTPRSVLAWKNGGGPGLLHQAIWDTLLLGAMMAAFCVVVLLAGEHIMDFLYDGKEFDGNAHTLTVLAVAMLALATGMPASNALATMERPRAIVTVGTIGALVTVVLVWWLMTGWGLLGAAYGFLVGNLVGAAGRWLAFFALVPRACDSAPVVRVLQSFTEASHDPGWVISRLGEGDHATVFAIQSKQPQPIWRAQHSLVVKLYKPEAALNAEKVNAQFDSLSKLHAALDGRTADGWKIFAPQPLYVCTSPLALVMTTVPGRDIDSCAAPGDELTSEIMDAARAFATAMERSWSRGQFHGDLGLRNILFGVQCKEISFIDAGTLESCRVCNDGTGCQRPAAFDLAHLLCELATDVTDMIGSPVARMRREIFVESALRTVIEKVDSREEKQRLLDEVWACVQAHLTMTLEISWSPHGLWHRFIKRIAIYRIDSMLDRLNRELDAGSQSQRPGRYEVERAVQVTR